MYGVMQESAEKMSKYCERFRTMSEKYAKMNFRACKNASFITEKEGYYGSV